MLTEKQRDMLADFIRPGESPYFGMYKAGYYGIDFEDAAARAAQCGVLVRQKDVESWKDGAFKYQMKRTRTAGKLNPIGMDAVASIEGRHAPATETGVPFDSSSLSDFPRYPESWVSTERRFFPCTIDNRPMQKWGWSRDFTPQLLDYASARALSPCGWVGQNMLYQRFVVLDIDGRGHGEDDPWVIAFGNMFRDTTMCMEDPAKPGSFHLYFETDRIIPVRHFPHAKLDLMGNAVNAAVYLKNKVSNGLPMQRLDDEVWRQMLSYQRYRKETQCPSTR